MFKRFVLKRLQKYVRQYFIKHPEIKLVAVVGSVGKTSTKHADWRKSDEYIQDDIQFIDGMEWLCSYATKLAQTPAEERLFWRSYILTSVFANAAFEGTSVQGYSGGLDQVVGWKDPKPDDTYWKSYIELHDNLGKYATASSELEAEGKLLALKGVALRIGHQLEREIVYGNNTKRSGRLRVVADIYKQLAKYDIDQANELLLSTPLISQHIYELSDQWNYRFS